MSSSKALKQKAGRLLSKYLRELATEETELVTVNGEDRLATRAEALGRLMWKMALGYEANEPGKDGVLIKVKHRPDKAMMCLLYDRIEGKAPMMGEQKAQRTVADRVDDQGRKRITEAGKNGQEAS